MEQWSVKYESNAFADIEKLDRSVRRQIIDRLEWFADNFNEITPAPLHGEWKGFFKFRITDWRVVYSFESSAHVIKVHQIDRRDRIYKKRR